MYDLELLRKFCMVAKYQSYTKAADELYISQPALTKSIQKLEEQMNVKLFERNGRNIKLTTQGKIIYDAIAFKIDYICNIDAIVNSSLKHKNSIRIGANSSIIREILTPSLKRDMKKFSNINIMIENKATGDLVTMLKEKKLDILIINLPTDSTSGLDIVKLKEVHDVLVAGEKFEYYKDQKITLEQLQLMPIITYSKGSVVRDHFQNFCFSNNVLIKPHIEVTRSSLVTNFCSLGLGVGIVVYEFMKEEIKKNNLFVLDLDPAIPPREIGILTRNEPKSELLNSLIQSLLDAQKESH